MLREISTLDSETDWKGADDDQLLSRVAELEKAPDMLESAWGIIANAAQWNVPDDDTPCGNGARLWREAAIAWREKYHAALRSADQCEDEAQLARDNAEETN
jgi:hypothetical protein